MTDLIRKIAYFKMETPNKPGQGAQILGILRDGGINLMAFSGFPRGRKAQMDFIPEDVASFKKVCKKAGLKISPQKTGFMAQGEDRVGAVSEILTRLGEAKINVTAIDALVTKDGQYVSIFWVKPEDVRKTAKLLRIS